MSEGVSECWLAGFEDVPCSVKIDRHHGISKQMLRGAPRARAYVEQHMDIFGFPVCSNHNSMKLADLPEARALLFHRRCQELGYAVVGMHLSRLRRLMKSSPPELRLEAILNFLPEDVGAIPS